MSAADDANPDPKEFGSHTPARRRMRRRETGYNPRFLTFSCYRRMQLLGTPALRAVFVEALRRAHAKRRFELIAWVVMPDHVHLMVRPMPGVR